MQVARSLLYWLQSRKGSESGQALVEYALLIGLVSVVAVGGLTTFGGGVGGLYGTLKAVTDAMAAAIGA